MPEAKVRSEDLRERITFQRRAMVDDGMGNSVPGGEFETEFTVWARLMPLRGGESVLAARLQGRQPYIITTRQSSQTRQINESWQAVDARNPDRVFAITAPPTDPDGKRAWLDILVTQGGTS